ncbi:MAG: GNAT family N-acetyltransferase [Myxococcales bacterium]|nr:GNAT family N-acetyltransferase [Myxococcales bacterium]
MLHRLRPSDSSDFEWLMALDRTSHRDTVVNAGGSWNDTDHRARFTRAFASQPMMVVEVDGEPAGMLSVAWDEEPVELHEVQLLPRWQGRGLGTRLVHDVLLEARQRGSAVALWVWEGNPAQVLYERLGFGVVERTDRRLRMRWAGGDDAVLRAAMSPWADAHRRRPWVRRLFEAWPDESPDDAVGFAGFVAGREGLPASLSVLELGCGSGRRLRPLAALGWRVTGHDPDHHAAARRIAAVAGSAITTVHAGLDALDVEAAHDLVLVLGGGLWSLLE